MRLVLLDSYDSFTWNLVDYLKRVGAEVEVVENDTISVEDERFQQADGIVLSPGPKRPEEAGVLMDVIARYAEVKPFLGVCLGHQAIGMHFGMELVEAPEPVHGQTSLMYHNGTGLFRSLPKPMEVMRYHSLVLQSNGINKELIINATTTDGLPMAMQHVDLPIFGVQFHPESILTPEGLKLLFNWVDEIKKRKKN